MVELRDVFDFPSPPTFKTLKTRFRTPPRASFFFIFISTKAARRGACSHSFYLLCQTNARRVGSNNTALRRKRRAFSAPSTSFSTPFLILLQFRRQNAFSSGKYAPFLLKNAQKKKKREVFRVFFTPTRFFDAPFDASPPFFPRSASNWQSPPSPVDAASRRFSPLLVPTSAALPRRERNKKIGRAFVGTLPDACSTDFPKSATPKKRRLFFPIRLFYISFPKYSSYAET